MFSTYVAFTSMFFSLFHGKQEVLSARMDTYPG